MRRHLLLTVISCRLLFDCCCVAQGVLRRPEAFSRAVKRKHVIIDQNVFVWCACLLKAAGATPSVGQSRSFRGTAVKTLCVKISRLFKTS